MRLRANKVVYMSVGGALTSGLLVSAFVLPQAQLTASTDCYGDCHSALYLSESRSSVPATRERQEEFQVRLDADSHRMGRLDGPVTVETTGYASQVLCTFRLHHGTGECSLRNGELAPGSYQVVASYSGDANFSPATSNTVDLTVTSGVPSVTELALSRHTVPASREWREHFSVWVGGNSPWYEKSWYDQSWYEKSWYGQSWYERARDDQPWSSQPTGSVEVYAGSQVLCTIHLADGQGSCSLSNAELAPGHYEITAVYSGDGTFSSSQSGLEYLSVRRY